MHQRGSERYRSLLAMRLRSLYVCGLVGLYNVSRLRPTPLVASVRLRRLRGSGVDTPSRLVPSHPHPVAILPPSPPDAVVVLLSASTVASRPKRRVVVVGVDGVCHWQRRRVRVRERDRER